jgi:hypothetical protein
MKFKYGARVKVSDAFYGEFSGKVLDYTLGYKHLFDFKGSPKYIVSQDGTGNHEWFWETQLEGIKDV